MATSREILNKSAMSPSNVQKRLRQLLMQDLMPADETKGESVDKIDLLKDEQERQGEIF
tara:strand:- start:3456 stop:3632 length:177 start_codon:yes stop_codon:yes gene_type:complete